MKKLFGIVWIWISAAFLAACTTLQSVSYERLQAADISIPEQIHSVGVINCMPVLDLDSQNVIYSSRHLEGDGKMAAEVLAEEIAATNYFQQVIICDSAFHKDYPESDEEPGLSADEIDSLVHVLGVDMLFSVERVHVELKEGVLFVPELLVEVPVLDGMVTPLVRTYISGRSTPLFSFSKTDTICWELTPDLTYERIVKDASVHASTLPVSHLLPHWKEVERYYFDGGNVNMRDAGVFVREQNWEEAARLWQELYDTKKGKTKMRAAFNLALYDEMSDRFDRAKEYLDVAASLAEKNSWEASLIQSYQSLLNEERGKNLKLKLQMRRFE